MAAQGGAGRKVARGTRLIVTPGTQAIYRAALKAGYVETLLEAGAVVTPATCGACSGGHMGALGPDEVCITASTRNFKGRMGDPSARIFMGSPATVRGIGAGRRDRPSRRILPGRRGMSGSNMLAGRVWKFGDNINTDLMLPGPYLVRSEAEQATAVFINNRPEFLREMHKGDVIIGGFNYGMGSSRPAARSLRNCGVGFLLAETINGLFFRNAVNLGFRAFECPGVSARRSRRATPRNCRSRTGPPPTARTGQTLAVTPVPKMLLDMMLGGGVLPMLEAQGLIAPKAAG